MAHWDAWWVMERMIKSVLKGGDNPAQKMAKADETARTRALLGKRTHTTQKALQAHHLEKRMHVT